MKIKMSDLSKEIEEVASLRDEYESKRQRVDERVRELFEPEFERIKAKMPKGYEIMYFDVYDGEVSIPNPSFEDIVYGDRVVVSRKETDWLNEQFDEEFSRIRREYGFVVRFDRVYHMG